MVLGSLPGVVLGSRGVPPTESHRMDRAPSGHRTLHGGGVEDVLEPSAGVSQILYDGGVEDALGASAAADVAAMSAFKTGTGPVVLGP